jgi:hypothetical protein
MGDLSDHFSAWEFASPDTGECRMVQDFIEDLERFRSFCGDRVIHVSRGGGYRTAIYNAEIRRCEYIDEGADRPHGNFHGRSCPKCGDPGKQRSAIRSRHMLGTEADIKVEGLTPDEVADLAEEFGFRNIGRYNTFTHVGQGGRPGRTARWDMRTKGDPK